MDRVIWKYPVPVESRFVIEMPAGSDILTVQVQREQAVMWAMVDRDTPLKRRVFSVVGTGHDIRGSLPAKYIGTFQLGGGAFVGHLFEIPDTEPVRLAPSETRSVNLTPSKTRSVAADTLAGALGAVADEWKAVQPHPGIVPGYKVREPDEDDTDEDDDSDDDDDDDSEEE